MRYAFSGFAAMAPIMVAALFWKRSTKWGALAATIFVAGFLLWTALMQTGHKPGDILWQIGRDQSLLHQSARRRRLSGTVL